MKITEFGDDESLSYKDIESNLYWLGTRRLIKGNRYEKCIFVCLPNKRFCLVSLLHPSSYGNSRFASDNEGLTKIEWVKHLTEPGFYQWEVEAFKTYQELSDWLFEDIK